ncbi:LamB/YcsF family protein [Nigerium massiliense]|uniref:LamB/YcsF family protein n=1 Tax=Nigerium massiliense TaxID=1522317 RepID=UPI00058CD302|nr:5-oxoprolinase subunit PxpA [Nigerium massiliense]
MSASTHAAGTVDLNADLGESLGTWTMGDDAAMLDVVTSANIACGFHAGDPLTTRRTVADAAARGIAVGAHPSYRDLVGFGRRVMDYAPDELAADVLYQLGALEGICRAAGTEVAYVKPHGALYNRIVADRAQAAAVVEAVVAFKPGLAVLGLPGSAFLEVAAEAGLRPVREAFVDRAYNPDGTLVSRRLPGAVLHEPDAVAARVLRLARTGLLTAADGTDIELGADSLCIHGDSPGAVAMAREVRATLVDAGVRLAPFAG